MVTNRPLPRTGTITWGAVLLIVAALAFGIAIFDLRVLPSAPLTWIVAFGVVFTFVAIVLLLTRAVSRSVTSSTAVVAAEPDPQGQPVD